MSSFSPRLFFYPSIPTSLECIRELPSQSTSVRPLERVDLSIFGSNRRCGVLSDPSGSFSGLRSGCYAFTLFFFYFNIFFISIPASGQSGLRIAPPYGILEGRCHSDSGRSGGVRKANFGAHR